MVADRFGNVGFAQDFFPGQHDHALDAVAQFADIAGPRIGDQFGEGVRGDAGYVAFVFAGEFGDEAMDQAGNVTFAVAQRRQFEVDHAQAVKEVFAESPLADHFAQVAVGGGDETDVDLDGFGAADPFEGTGFQHAQQLDLGGGIDFTDFVEEQRAVVGDLEPPLVAFGGAGERSFFVTEEFAFKQRRGQRGAVDRHEIAGAAAPVVDHPGEHLLAGAAFAGQQHGRPGRGDGFDQRHHFGHRVGGIVGRKHDPGRRRGHGGSGRRNGGFGLGRLVLAALRRAASAASITASSLSSLTGLATKSNAPFLTAATASPMEP